MKSRIYDYGDPSTPEVITEDGSGIRVRMDVMDGHFQHRHRTALSDQIAQDALCWSGHRPGPVQDGLRLNARDAGAAYARQGARDEAFSELCRRSANAWRDGPAVSQPLNAMPPPMPDQPDDGDDDIKEPPDYTDRLAVKRAQDARERARIQRDCLGDQRWRTAGITDPAEADRVMRQAAQWRHGA